MSRRVAGSESDATGADIFLIGTNDHASLGLPLLDASPVAVRVGSLKSEFVRCIAAGAGYMLGELVGTERDKEAALLVAQSFLLSAGLTQGLKMTFKRERPDDSRDDQFSFFSSDASDTNSAFPSGHATNAFSMATVLSNVYETDAPWLGWVLYPTATLTSLARVNNERHWASDVFFGGALGYFIGRMVVRYSPFRDNDRISLLPMSDGDYNGLRVVHRL